MLLGFISSLYRPIAETLDRSRLFLRNSEKLQRNDILTMTSKSLDKDSFKQTWRVYAIRVPSKLTQRTLRVLNEHVLRVPKVQLIRKVSENDSIRHLLLRYFAYPPDSTPFSPRGNMCFDKKLIGDRSEIFKLVKTPKVSVKLDEHVSSFLNQLSETDLVEDDVNLVYEHWPIDAVLRTVLPEGTTM